MWLRGPSDGADERDTLPLHRAVVRSVSQTTRDASRKVGRASRAKAVARVVTQEGAPATAKPESSTQWRMASALERHLCVPTGQWPEAAAYAFRSGLASPGGGWCPRLAQSAHRLPSRVRRAPLARAVHVTVLGAAGFWAKGRVVFLLAHATGTNRVSITVIVAHAPHAPRVLVGFVGMARVARIASLLHVWISLLVVVLLSVSVLVVSVSCGVGSHGLPSHLAGAPGRSPERQEFGSSLGDVQQISARTCASSCNCEVDVEAPGLVPPSVGR